MFKRERWEEIGLEERFVGSLFAHVGRLFAMIAQGVTFDYLPDSYVLTRGGNDSFMDRGIVNRYAKVIDGYHELAATYFGADSAEAAHVRRVVRASSRCGWRSRSGYAVARERPEELAELTPDHPPGLRRARLALPALPRALRPHPAAGSWRRAIRCARSPPR